MAELLESLSNDAARVASLGPISSLSEMPASPTPVPAVLATGKDAVLDASVDGESKRDVEPALDAEKPVTQRRQSTVKYSDSDGLSKGAFRPQHQRRASTISVESKYSQMTENYFEILPRYNALASWFTWVLLAGFVLGPGAQQAALEATGNRNSTSQIPVGLVKKVPLLILSVVCSGIGGIGMIALWIKQRNNYIWLIHKIFFPGFMNGLAGTLAASINIWAIQGGHFRFNAETIVTISITAGSTVICLVLTLIYQLVLLPVKREHLRLKRAARMQDPEGPTYKGTAEEQDFSDAQDSVANALIYLSRHHAQPSTIALKMGCIPSKPPSEPTAQPKPATTTNSDAAAETPVVAPQHVPEVTLHEATPVHSRKSAEQNKPTVEQPKSEEKKDGGSTSAANGQAGGGTTATAAGATVGNAEGSGAAAGGGGGGGGGGDGGGE